MQRHKSQTTPGQKIIEGLEEAVAHGRGEIPLPTTVTLPDGRRFVIDTVRDTEAGVWIATSHVIPGLVIQGATWPEMMRKLMLVIPTLTQGSTDAK